VLKRYAKQAEESEALEPEDLGEPEA